MRRHLPRPRGAVAFPTPVRRSPDGASMEIKRGIDVVAPSRDAH
jgi:hypothetical protein